MAGESRKPGWMQQCMKECAGFIGSHLTNRLLTDGYEVTGIDCFTDYYPERIKKQNIAHALENSHFEFMNKDIRELNPDFRHIKHIKCRYRPYFLK
jgi:nucleoside-diphosphate-sugar epimerase